ncbi:type II toxin-antitoxin system RelE/ParE family toxin [Demequina sp. TTPB684]|uniref:type II toxin-antitoxin system RelE family toxin n=1 Tax=unclassified Demequina TaxID=2620311 RepID=UPI001CF5CD6D|nr:type II toxin-antitoxin system RelE/ParE family toxin [Demequina sp. TMPB413]MCB2413261.1 type II toxin-antitoxin system RelE/ParE family toxin [Demequina sp. TTPB684]UPU88721.1 type II toxin-antitoxin system RelE/ParE family toxin [Demequina sp. TMPB413]
MYRVEFTSAAARQVRKLPREHRARIQARMRQLGNEPRPAGAIKLAGETTAWRVRVGDYRVIYDIFDDVLVITVVAVGHRREVYRA